MVGPRLARLVLPAILAGASSSPLAWLRHVPTVLFVAGLPFALLAVAGFVGSVARRRFLGTWMGVYSIILMIGVKAAQHSLPVIGLLWNPRVLPFVYLLRYLLALIGGQRCDAAGLERLICCDVWRA